MRRHPARGLLRKQEGSVEAITDANERWANFSCYAFKPGDDPCVFLPRRVERMKKSTFELFVRLFSVATNGRLGSKKSQQ
jgi:hypothetical protein